MYWGWALINHIYFILARKAHCVPPWTAVFWLLPYTLVRTLAEAAVMVWLAFAPTWNCWVPKLPSSSFCPLIPSFARCGRVPRPTASLLAAAPGGRCRCSRHWPIAQPVHEHVAGWCRKQRARLQRSAPARCRRWHCALPGSGRGSAR